ncbi:hypothetical protein NDU88_000894 [Pleurodeles waltl]|uniref:Uncharacterized protein n=1 Tax=Pleurodeles waltl TaxID=8319 RepID=A0AAV7VUV0_PLEWA|nr:hypothetical protein NDU88_000894 [Pleurodeles waltl]
MQLCAPSVVYSDDEDCRTPCDCLRGARPPPYNVRRESDRKRPPPKCTVEIGGTIVRVLIDTMAFVSVIDLVQFDKLIPLPKLAPTKERINPYGGTEPLSLKGVINIKVVSNKKATQARFCVSEWGTGTLLGCHTEEDLGLVFFTKQVHESQAAAIPQECPQLFKGLG